MGDGNKGRVTRLWRGAALLAAAIFLVISVHGARRETPTIDEFAHLPAGCVCWHQGDFSLYAKNPPLMKLWMALPVVADPRVVVPEFSGNPLGWGPWEYGRRFLDANRDLYFSFFLRARMMVVGLTLATGLLLFVWTRRLFGERGASVAAVLFLLSPPVLAHGRLATIDMGCTFTILLACFTLAWACRRRDTRAIAIAGGALGLALAVKFTALLILPAALALLALRRRPAASGTGKRTALLARDAAVLLACSIFVVNGSMGFQGSLRRLDTYRFHSAFCSRVQAALPGFTPVPLPRAYVSGFDAQKRDTESGEFGSYLLGEWSKDGWWYYNLVALLVKTPIPVLLLALAGIVLWRRVGIGASEAWPILLPCVSLFLFLSAFNRLDVGVRYLLPLFPFLHLIAGVVFAERLGPGRGRWRDGLAAVAMAVGLFTAVRVAPDPLTYFNAVAAVRAEGTSGSSIPTSTGARTCTGFRRRCRDSGRTGPSGSFTSATSIRGSTGSPTSPCLLGR